MKPLLFVLILFAFSGTAQAEDDTTIGAFGGVGYTTTEGSDDADGTLGASISSPINHTFDIEIGAMRQENVLQIPLMVRIGLDKLLTVVGGVFGEMGVGGEQRDFVLGWTAGAGVNFDISDRVHAFGEGRYLSDITKGTDEGGLLALAGLRFALN